MDPDERSREAVRNIARFLGHETEEEKLHRSQEREAARQARARYMRGRLRPPSRRTVMRTTSRVLCALVVAVVLLASLAWWFRWDIHPVHSQLGAAYALDRLTGKIYWVRGQLSSPIEQD